MISGSCDNHLKNLSFVWSPEEAEPHLSPAYDIVSTTVFSRFSRDMSMAIGGVRDIDAIGADEFLEAAHSIGVSPRVFRETCEPIAEHIAEALFDASPQIEERHETAPFIAEDIVQEMQPRLQVIHRLCR